MEQPRGRALGACTTALGFTPGCCSFGCLPVCTCSHLPPSETLQSCQLGAVRTGQSRVSGTNVSLGLSLAVTHLFSSEGRAQGNSSQPKYRAGLPGASEARPCRKATRVAGNRSRRVQGGGEAGSCSTVLLWLVQRAGRGRWRPANVCCLGGERLPESSADHAVTTSCSHTCSSQPSPVPTTLALGSLHQLTQLGLAMLWP